MLENCFQSQLKSKLEIMFPGCIVLRGDSSRMQGIPDLLILYNKKWAALECKKDHRARKQPNQQWYINKLDEMSFAAFIFPENVSEVLHDLQQALSS